ncbi:short transient receptor potential channel 4-associated protein-like [Hydra vulgaris]|uniref:Short transient receptor potential channel 4-associated protein-like n=1 Tax=Hydra vulgaris TaxID=6087 RepID=A0ABM4DP87_HYDVU
MPLKIRTSVNVYHQLHQYQIFGKTLRSSQITCNFFERKNVSYFTIQMLIKELNDLYSTTPFNCFSALDCLKCLKSFINDSSLDKIDLGRPSKNDIIPEIFNQLDGVKILVRILFECLALYTKTVALNFKNEKYKGYPYHTTILYGLQILQPIVHHETSVAHFLGTHDEFIIFLFTVLEQKSTFDEASALLEELLAINRKVIDLSKIENLSKLIVNVNEGSFPSFCCILSSLIADLSYERNTLLQQDKEDNERSHEKMLCENNQEILLANKQFIPRMVRMCSKPFFRNYRVNNETVTLSVQDLNEVMHKVEFLYVLSLLLCGKNKTEIQQKLSHLQFVPALSNLFDTLDWNSECELFLRLNHMGSEDCDCTPEVTLKIQLLRFIHSFCDHNENRYHLLSVQEALEIKKICEKEGYPLPDPIHPSNSKYMCIGSEGLLTKIVNVLKRCPPNNLLRFWLSRAIEGFLRGGVTPIDQRFLIDKDLIKHLVHNLINENLQSKEIIQSSFDLLGELMKFNACGYIKFNECIESSKQIDCFLSMMTANIVDSNMFLRSTVLSYEHFLNTGLYDVQKCLLSNLIQKWENKVYLIYKLITSISIDNLTQENVSCLNTTLVFLMFSYNHGVLSQYLEAFVMEEQAQKQPGLILSNLWELLIFWQRHYLKKTKDCFLLEQSSSISFKKWKSFVDMLLSNDSSTKNCLIYHLTPKQRSIVRLKRLDRMFRDI